MFYGLAGSTSSRTTSHPTCRRATSTCRSSSGARLTPRLAALPRTSTRASSATRSSSTARCRRDRGRARTLPPALPRRLEPRAYALQLSNGAPLVQIAGDRGLLEAPVSRPAVPLAPAERVDVVVDFRRVPPGTQVQLVNGLGPVPPPPCCASTSRARGRLRRVRRRCGRVRRSPAPVATKR